MLSQLSHPSLPRLEVSCPPETFLTITPSCRAASRSSRSICSLSWISSRSGLELEMAAEPKAKLSTGDKNLLLRFADDSSALFFRMRMREKLWGKGHAVWRSHNLQKSDR